MVAFTAGSVLTAQNLNSAFNALTIRTVTGTSDTLVLADNGGAVSYSNASPITATVPPFSSVAYANGTVIQLLNLGAGVVTLTAGVGVTLNGLRVTLAQNTGGTLIKTATNTWYFLPSDSAPMNTASASKLDTFSTASTSFVDVTGMSVTITPSSTAAKVLLLVTLGLVANGASQVTRFNLVRGSTTIAQPSGSPSTPSTVNFLLENLAVAIPGPISFVDSPASAAATTYKLQMAVTGNTSYLNRRSAGGFETISHIFAMEVPA